MADEPYSPRDVLLAAKGHALVMGGPGSGKTTLALDKAMHRISEGLKQGQSVLFLSFSRAAVARLNQATRHAGAEAREAVRARQLSLQTFHSFFWQLIQAHGYLLGAPRSLTVLMPHDEKVLSGGVKYDTPEWAAWLPRRVALFDEGRVAFDLFAPLAVDLIRRSPLIKTQVASQYPLVIVDEAQDTGPDAWAFLVEMKNICQIICLADLDQQIFDHLPGIGPERVKVIRDELTPTQIDLGQANNRSPGTEIHAFAADILAGTARGAPYVGVTTFSYNPKTADPSSYLRAAMAVGHREIRSRGANRSVNCAILATTGREVALISNALMTAARPVPHRVIFDEAQALLAARFAAYLLEPKPPGDAALIEVLSMLAAMQRATGSSGGRTTAAKLVGWANDLASGKTLKWPKVKAIQAMFAELKAVKFTGDPGKDWLTIKKLLLSSTDADFHKIAGELDYLVAFRRGQAITDQLAALWKTHGAYTNARKGLEAALAQDAILGGTDDLSGIHVMTIHRSKGKQFDTVILLRRGNAIAAQKWRSSFVWRDDTPPYQRSRKILRVGITRARTQVVMLNPTYPNCPLLSGHRFK
ncbi:MAG: ATP-dependent helicase [Mesorhizobium sp.]|nr:MAG: ATP-dependent helicase [Mesorhizobium sp.]